MITLLDGPMGTELDARGVRTELPLWSAHALRTAPETVSAIHRDYVEAGAQVLTANTFRTQRRTAGADWETLTRRAVDLARGAAPVGAVRVAGSISPLEDCYRPDLSPPEPRPEHREMARLLAEAGVDLLLVETFPHLGEARIATEEAVATGLETWTSFTAGPQADLLTPEDIRAGARAVIEAGAAGVLVNCIPASKTLPFVEALVGLGVPFGAYANAGHADEHIGWRADPTLGPARYLAFARTWVDAGATLLGSCCGTGPGHIRALRALLAPR